MHNDLNRAAGEAMSAADPLLTLVEAFQAERARFNADDADDAADEVELFRLYDLLEQETAECLTSEGAIAALRLVADSIENDRGGYQAPVLAAVYRFALEQG